MISFQKACERAGLSRPKAERLVKAGLIDPPVEIDGWKFVEEDKVEAMRHYAIIDFRKNRQAS